MSGETIEDDLRSALAGDELALNRLVRKLTPVIQIRVTHVLFRWRTGTAAGRDVRQEVEDLTQDVFLVLFADDWKVLRSWEPERGMSLLNFVGFVAKRQTLSTLRNGKRSPWKEIPTLIEDLDRATSELDPEEVTALREKLRLLDERLTEELSPLGWHLFDLLFLRELSIEEVVQQTGMSPDAIYQWRRRLRLLILRLLEEM